MEKQNYEIPMDMNPIEELDDMFEKIFRNWRPQSQEILNIVEKGRKKDEQS